MESLKWRTPHEALTGTTPDISMIYCFHFYDRFYIKRDKTTAGGRFPSESDEMAGRFVGFSEHVGHQMTYAILTEDTNKIIYRSRVKLASLQPNIQLASTPEIIYKVNNSVVKTK